MVEISDRQLEIIEAAGKILTQSGVSGLTIKNLAKEMKFSESAIYRHFASKEDIVVGMLNYLARRMDMYLSEITRDDKIDSGDKFLQIFQRQFEFFKQNPQFVVAVFSDGLIEDNQRVNEAILRIMAIKMKHMMPVIMEGQRSGIFTNQITADEMLHFVMGAFRLQMFKWRLSSFQFDIVRQGNHMLESLIILISPKG
ncbi:MAG: TetR/AcrR family transcriptional regulator [Candidatus Competibacteraceae bacterium]|nr:TetR/AcrR family transcriptional regulator [Candidatus Competibacteraceae bacterium]